MHVLNKGQPSIKGVKGVSGKEHVTTLDLMLCLKHRKTAVPDGRAIPTAVRFWSIRSSVDAIGESRAGRRTDEVIRQSSDRSREQLLGCGHHDAGHRRSLPELGAVERDGRWTLRKRIRAKLWRSRLRRWISDAKTPCHTPRECRPATKPLGRHALPGAGTAPSIPGAQLPHQGSAGSDAALHRALHASRATSCSTLLWLRA